MTADRIANNTDVASRRLAAGLAVSLLLHGILLSLQFGLPQRALGQLERITVRLTPAAPPAVEAPVLAAASPALPESAPSARAVEPGGMRIVDIPPSRPIPRKQLPPRVPARRISREQPHPRPEALSERVIASERSADSFAVPQPEPEAASQTANDPLALQAGAEEGTGTAAKQADARTDAADGGHEPAPQASAREEKERRAEEVARLAVQERMMEQARAEEELARRREDEQVAMQTEEQRRLAAEQERLRAEQALAREDEARRAADAFAREQAGQADLARQQEEQRRIAEERARATERLAEQRLAEQQRLAEESAREQLRQAQQALALEAEQRKAAEALARQQAAEEQAQLLAREEQAARELAERQRREAELRRQEQAERELAARRLEEMRQAQLRQREQERLAAQQETEQRQRNEEAARQQAEQLAQQRLAQETAHQQEELVRKQRADEQARQADAGAGPGAGADSGGAGRTAPGGLGGGLPRGALGSDMANRARELVRGLGVLGGAPPAARQPEDAQRQKRRMVSTGAERDAPLRLYVDAIRQKIERNGLLNGAQLAAGRVRVDPVVSVAIRSDGSVEDVLIVRSSGRAELDEAVRRIVRLNARYSVFPPNVAAHYDVIEIRRIWTFAEGLKLLEELR